MTPVRCLALFLMVVLLGGGIGTGARAEPEDPADGLIPLSFFHSPWTAAVFGHEAAGRLGWLEGPMGSLRLELGRGRDDVTPDILLAQSGEGWAVILGPDDEGTVNGWGREWRQVDPGLGQLVRAVVAFLSEPEAGRSTRRIHIPDLLEDGNPSDPHGSFRRDLVRRGRGRGGTAEIIVLERLETDGDSPWRYEIRSTRRPGKVRLGRPAALGLECPVPEVFVPLWPLSALIGRPAENPGTSSAGEG